MSKKQDSNPSFRAADFDVGKFKMHLHSVANQDIHEVLAQKYCPPSQQEIEPLNANFTATTTSLLNLLNPNSHESDALIQTLKVKYQPPL
jgi:hypothetical protein